MRGHLISCETERVSKVGGQPSLVGDALKEVLLTAMLDVRKISSVSAGLPSGPVTDTLGSFPATEMTSSFILLSTSYCNRKSRITYCL